MPVPELDVPKDVLNDPGILVGDVDAFMVSYEQGYQLRCYRALVKTVQNNFTHTVTRELRIMGGIARHAPDGTPLPRIPGCSI